MSFFKSTQSNLSGLVLLMLLFSSSSFGQNHDKEIRQLLQLVEYIGVDYSSAVRNGEVVDKGEYQEMLDFSNIVVEKVLQILKDNQQLIQQSHSLQNAVAKLEEYSEVKSLSMQLKKSLSVLSSELDLPRSLVETNTVEKTYQQNCSSCHGLSGAGDGELGQNLQPMPTDFTDLQRAKNRSIFGLYQAISNGLDGTAMPAFKDFSVELRWSLAFKVGGIAFNTATKNKDDLDSQLSLQDFVMFSPNEISANNDAVQEATIASMRSKPAAYFFSSESSLQVTREQLSKAQEAYQNNQLILAKTLAVSAYLDGFELIEHALDAHDKPLRKQIEIKLMKLRKQLSITNNKQQVDEAIAESLLLLDQAEILLTDSKLSTATIFTASFVILLREGLEALLVVLALFTILLRSEHKRGRKYLHIGWVSALFAGFLTWLAAEYLIEISGASREIMEGVAALLAAIILVFVGFWMHSKSKAGQWQNYIKQNIDHKLKTGSLWGIAGLAFITVYREVFETVLFYQSLILQTQASQQYVLLSGFLFGLFILALVAWLVVKYSVKMPIAKFFSSTSYIILILAFILAGKAIAALQEAAIIPITAFPLNISFDWFGIYPTWEGLSSQLAVLIISAVLLLKRD